MVLLLVTSCTSTQLGDGLSLTFSNNVDPVALTEQRAVAIPHNQLPVEIQGFFIDSVTGLPVDAVLAEEGDILDFSGDTIPVFPLDARVTKQILSPSVVAQLAGLVTANNPGLFWLTPLLALFSRRFRRNGLNAVKNLTPGVQKPNGSRGVDLAEAALDLGRLIGLAHSSPQVHQEVDTERKKKVATEPV